MATNNYIVRGVDGDSNWLFGAGLNNYAYNNAAVALDIQMTLQSFLGNCFFATNEGIDWFNLLGAVNQELSLLLAVNGAILGIPEVTGIHRSSVDVEDRDIQIVYAVQTVYSTLQGSFVYSLGPTGS